MTKDEESKLASLKAEAEREGINIDNCGSTDISCIEETIKAERSRRRAPKPRGPSM